MTTTALESSPLSLMESPSAYEVVLLKAFVVAEPIVIILSIVAFLVAAVLLLTKTRAKGRFLVAAGAAILIGLFLYQKDRSVSLQIGNTLLRIATIEFLTAFGASLVALGFLRLAWFVSKARSQT